MLSAPMGRRKRRPRVDQRLPAPAKNGTVVMFADIAGALLRGQQQRRIRRRRVRKPARSSRSVRSPAPQTRCARRRRQDGQWRCARVQQARARGRSSQARRGGHIRHPAHAEHEARFGSPAPLANSWDAPRRRRLCRRPPSNPPRNAHRHLHRRAPSRRSTAACLGSRRPPARAGCTASPRSWAQAAQNGAVTRMRLSCAIVASVSSDDGKPRVRRVVDQLVARVLDAQVKAVTARTGTRQPPRAALRCSARSDPAARATAASSFAVQACSCRGARRPTTDA